MAISYVPEALELEADLFPTDENGEHLIGPLLRMTQDKGTDKER